MDLGYRDFLTEYGLTEDYVQLMVQNTDDQISIDMDEIGVTMKRSVIHGDGVFASRDVSEGVFIGPARLNGFRTQLGRYVNHSRMANCKFVCDYNNDLYIATLSPVTDGEELTIDYRQAMSVNGSGIEPIFSFPALITSHGIDISAYDNRQKIELIEWLIIHKIGNEIDKLPIRHFVFGGIYAREMTIPQDMIITGKIHLKDHIATLSKGDISIMTDDGMARISAPYTFTATSGIKKIGFAHAESIMTTYHVTEKTDIAEIEAELFSDGDISWVDDLMQERIVCQQE